MARRPPPQSRWYRWKAKAPDSENVEIFLTRQPAARFHLHWHEEWSLGAILKGRCRFSCAGKPWLARRGDLVLIPPLTAHTSSTSPRGFAMVMIYLPAQPAALHLGLGRDLPALRTHVWHNPSAAQALQRATEQRHLDAIWRILTRTVAHCRRAGADRRALRRVDPRIARVCRLLQVQTGRLPDLQALADSMRLSREHFHRLFKQTMGITPGQYLRLTRIGLAKRLLGAGAQIAEVADACGFSDQSHFSRWFQRYLGITPGRFATSAAED